jgi:hypothetical protein
MLWSYVRSATEGISQGYMKQTFKTNHTLVGESLCYVCANEWRSKREKFNQISNCVTISDTCKQHNHSQLRKARKSTSITRCTTGLNALNMSPI